MHRTSMGTILAATGAALVLALTGCGPAGTPAATPTPTVDAVAALAAALSKTAAIDLTFVLDAGPGESDISGAYDATSGIAVATQTENGDQTTFTADGDSLYLSGSSDLNGLTVRLHANKLDKANVLSLLADPFPPATLLSGVVDATARSATEFEGSIDLAKITTKNDGAAALLTYVKTPAADRASDVTFTATTDADGYLVQLLVRLPNIDNGADAQYTVALADFGKDASNATPTGDSVIEAPDEAYTAS